MIGVIYTDAGTDKLVTNIEGVFNCAVHTTINDRNNVLDVTTPTGLEFFRSAFFTSRNVLLFRLVTVTVVADDHFDISETESFTLEEEVAFISADDLKAAMQEKAAWWCHPRKNEDPDIEKCCIVFEINICKMAT